VIASGRSLSLALGAATTGTRGLEGGEQDERASVLMYIETNEPVSFRSSRTSAKPANRLMRGRAARSGDPFQEAPERRRRAERLEAQETAAGHPDEPDVRCHEAIKYSASPLRSQRKPGEP
jgi:hypothetical protein